MTGRRNPFCYSNSRRLHGYGAIDGKADGWYLVMSNASLTEWLGLVGSRRYGESDGFGRLILGRPGTEGEREVNMDRIREDTEEGWLRRKRKTKRPLAGIYHIWQPWPMHFYLLSTSTQLISSNFKIRKLRCSLQNHLLLLPLISLAGSSALRQYLNPLPLPVPVPPSLPRLAVSSLSHSSDLSPVHHGRAFGPLRATPPPP